MNDVVLCLEVLWKMFYQTGLPVLCLVFVCWIVTR